MIHSGFTFRKLNFTGRFLEYLIFFLALLGFLVVDYVLFSTQFRIHILYIPAILFFVIGFRASFFARTPFAKSIASSLVFANIVCLVFFFKWQFPSQIQVNQTKERTNSQEPIFSIFEVSQIPIANERKTLNDYEIGQFAQAEKISLNKPESSVQKIIQKDKLVFKLKEQTADPMAQIERDTVNSFWLFGLNFNSIVSKISQPALEDENQLSQNSSN